MVPKPVQVVEAIPSIAASIVPWFTVALEIWYTTLSILTYKLYSLALAKLGLCEKVLNAATLSPNANLPSVCQELLISEPEAQVVLLARDCHINQSATGIELPLACLLVAPATLPIPVGFK